MGCAASLPAERAQLKAHPKPAGCACALNSSNGYDVSALPVRHKRSPKAKGRLSPLGSLAFRLSLALGCAIVPARTSCGRERRRLVMARVELRQSSSQAAAETLNSVWLVKAARRAQRLSSAR